MENLPTLFIKPGCPWCDEVMDFLDEHGIAYKKANIAQDRNAQKEMERISRQGKVPTLDWHGDVLADFGVAELVPFLKAKEVKMEDS